MSREGVARGCFGMFGSRLGMFGRRRHVKDRERCPAISLELQHCDQQNPQHAVMSRRQPRRSSIRRAADAQAPSNGKATPRQSLNTFQNGTHGGAKLRFVCRNHGAWHQPKAGPRASPRRRTEVIGTSNKFQTVMALPPPRSAAGRLCHTKHARCRCGSPEAGDWNRTERVPKSWRRHCAGALKC